VPNDKRTPAQKERIQARLERKAKELNKHYKDNVYEVKDNKVIRTKGRRPHKVSKKAPLSERSKGTLDPK
jgi:MoaA/NifB/PqqE/SkfB family radical SAM enzyme